MHYLKAFGCGLLGGMIGLIPGQLVFSPGLSQSLRECLVLSPFILISSAVGLLLGRKMAVRSARNWGAVPGALLGVAGLPELYTPGSPWYLLVLAPALASGASAYVLALALTTPVQEQT
jgi:hypothetical protein